MKAFLDAILVFTNWVWGIPMLLAIVGGGLYLSIRLGFLQFRKLPFILKNTIGKSFGQKGENSKFSGWQAVTGALASTLGAGNIIGTAMAIAFGGPGGVFWLWVAGLAACILTLPPAKAGGFSAQPLQPAPARSYTVSPSV